MPAFRARVRGKPEQCAANHKSVLMSHSYSGQLHFARGLGLQSLSLLFLRLFIRYVQAANHASKDHPQVAINLLVCPPVAKKVHDECAGQQRNESESYSAPERIFRAEKQAPSSSHEFPQQND